MKKSSSEAIESYELGKIKLFILALFVMSGAVAQQPTFEVKANDILGNNTEFWKAAGSDHLFYHALKPAGQYLLKRMGETNSHHYLQ